MPSRTNLKQFFNDAENAAEELKATKAFVLVANDEEESHSFGTSGWGLDEIKAVLAMLQQDLESFRPGGTDG